jgi:hypothetical protein
MSHTQGRKTMAKLWSVLSEQNFCNSIHLYRNSIFAAKHIPGFELPFWINFTNGNVKSNNKLNYALTGQDLIRVQASLT